MPPEWPMPPSSNTMASALSIVRTCVLSAQEALCAGSLEPLSQDGGTDTAATAKRQIGVTQDLFRGPDFLWFQPVDQLVASFGDCCASLARSGTRRRLS